MSDQITAAPLPCGRRWGDLLDQVADGVPGPLDVHQHRCVHCQAALTELTRLWQPMLDLAEQPVHAPAQLLDRVLDRVRDAAAASWQALVVTDQGTTRIAAKVIATIARAAARRVPGVQSAFGHTTHAAGLARGPADADGLRGLVGPIAAAVTAVGSTRNRPPGESAGVGVAGGSAVVDLAVTARYGTVLPTAAEQVRAAVIDDVTAMTGLPRVRVNVLIDDLT